MHPGSKHSGNPNKTPRAGVHGKGGFTLVEMLAVIGIMLIMMALAAPMIGDFATQSGRRSAVNILINSFEQARVAALQNGSNVYIVFADDNIRDSQPTLPYSAFIIVREAVEADGPSAANTLIPITTWRHLPDGIQFLKNPTDGLVVGNQNDTIDAILNKPLPLFPAGLVNAPPTFVFSPTGSLVLPRVGGPNGLSIYLGERFYDTATSQQIATNSVDPGVEQFLLTRSTGRIRHIVSQIPTNS